MCPVRLCCASVCEWDFVFVHTSNDLDFVTAAKGVSLEKKKNSLVLLLSSHCLQAVFSANRTERVFMHVHLSVIPGQM